MGKKLSTLVWILTIIGAVAAVLLLLAGEAKGIRPIEESLLPSPATDISVGAMTRGNGPSDEARARGRAPTMRAVPASQPASLTAARIISGGEPTPGTDTAKAKTSATSPSERLLPLPAWIGTIVVCIVLGALLVLVGRFPQRIPPPDEEGG